MITMWGMVLIVLAVASIIAAALLLALRNSARMDYAPIYPPDFDDAPAEPEAEPPAQADDAAAWWDDPDDVDVLDRVGPNTSPPPQQITAW